MNFLVETKNEYTIQLINILTPHLYEGFDSIYKESKKIIKKGEEKKILKAFQQFIKRIPSWNNNLIENETIRIRTASRCDFLNNLLKAVIKANIILLSNNNPNCNATQINQDFLDIPLSKFIHKCYIECARQFYNSPYLFYHEIKPIDRKRNQRDANDFIKQSIKEAIRKILPVQHILNQYLGNKMSFGEDQVDKPISNSESENLKQLLSQDLNSGIKISKDESSFKSNNDNVYLVEPEINLDTINASKVSYNNNDSDDDNETSKLLSEMRKNMEQNTLLFDIDDNINTESPINNSEHISIPITQYYSENKHSINNELRESEKQKTDNNQIKNIVISKIINTNENSIGLSERAPIGPSRADPSNESESSIQYIGKDGDYEDVFSNMLESNDSDKHSINKNTINNRDDKKRKDVYFSKYNGL